MLREKQGLVTKSTYVISLQGPKTEYDREYKSRKKGSFQAAWTC